MGPGHDADRTYEKDVPGDRGAQRGERGDTAGNCAEARGDAEGAAHFFSTYRRYRYVNREKQRSVTGGVRGIGKCYREDVLRRTAPT